MEIGIHIELNGRITNRRRMGRASFVDILSNGETVQLYINSEIDNYEEVISSPVGTFINVNGETFVTRTGHESVRVEEIRILLIPETALPIVRDDGENRYNETTNVEYIRRRRYLQTILDEDERNVFILRSNLINTIRNFFIERNYLEVETPILQPIYGGAEANPFVTRHESLDCDFYLRIAPELYLRRMLIGGYERVFEIGRNFRNEGLSNRHNPEFTVIELYTAFENYEYSMDITEDLLRAISDRFGNEIEYNNNNIDLNNIRRVRFIDIIDEMCDIDTNAISEGELVEVFENEVEENLINPTIVYDYPASISPLAMPREDDETIAERFELFIGGMEIGNAYSELNDVSLHLENLGDADQDFIEALRYGMPPATGIGIGIDRLVMLLTNRAIRDAIYFPAMRNENGR